MVNSNRGHLTSVQLQEQQEAAVRMLFGTTHPLFVVVVVVVVVINGNINVTDLTCVHRRGKTCFCCAPRKGNEVQLKLRTSAKDCTHLIDSEISNVYCNATLTNVAKTERKTIIIEKI